MSSPNQMAVFIDFENIALWAEREFFDFEVTPLIEYLQTRGPAVVKRAYGDWSRFSRYRDELMGNSIDLIQIYSIRGGKNRADIRMAIDALEISMTRPQINTYVIISGDSDFGPLVAKLREYGRYTVGIGPRSITHVLLVKSCDEFIYLETALGEMAELNEQSTIERESARGLLVKALQAHGQRGEVPILATRLKQTMLLMDPAFNEANFGYSQFKTWLEDNLDLVRLFAKDLQLYVAPMDYSTTLNGEVIQPASAVEGIASRSEVPQVNNLDFQYRQVLGRVKVSAIDMATRRDVLRDIYRELCEHPNQYPLEDILELLYERYESLDSPRPKSSLREILQMAARQQAIDFQDPSTSGAPLAHLAEGIDSEATFVCRAESDFAYMLVKAGLEIDPEQLAVILLDDNNQADYIQCMLEDLRGRNVITRKGKRYALLGRGVTQSMDHPALQILWQDIAGVEIPESHQPGVEMAHTLAKKAMVQRSQDFAASSNTYLLACRLLWDAVEAGEPGATLEDLRWFMASYASAIAGKLSQVNRDYGGARPYYLAFFALVQEDDPLWGRMRGLINPMLSYYWANAGRELDLNVSSWNLSMSSPAQIAVFAASHPNSELRRLWTNMTVDLAQVNPNLLRRIANQISLSRSESPENARIAEQIENILAKSNQSA